MIRERQKHAPASCSACVVRASHASDYKKKVSVLYGQTVLGFGKGPIRTSRTAWKETENTALPSGP